MKLESKVTMKCLENTPIFPLMEVRRVLLNQTFGLFIHIFTMDLITIDGELLEETILAREAIQEGGIRKICFPNLKNDHKGLKLQDMSKGNCVHYGKKGHKREKC